MWTKEDYDRLVEIPNPGICVWCGQSEMTEEHVIGRQFAKALEVPYPVHSMWGDHLLPADAEEISVKDRVCRTCNSNWMRKLDNRTIRFLRPALRPDKPQSFEMNEQEQQLLGAWATKVALLVQIRSNDLAQQHPEFASYGAGFVPASHLAAIHKTSNRPPRGTSVWIGMLDPSEAAPAIALGAAGTGRWQTLSGLEVPVDHGYLAILILRRLVVLVFGWDLADSGPRVMFDPDEILKPGSLVRVWPMLTRSVRWPPATFVTGDALRALITNPTEQRQEPAKHFRPMPLVDPPG